MIRVSLFTALLALPAVLAGAARADDFDPAFDPAFDPVVAPAPVPALAELAADTTVVFTGDELVRRGFRTLGDALAFEAGFVRERAAGGQRYSLYGVRNGVALIVDGVPLVVDGERDVLDVDDVLDLAEVERVEIVKGPSSTFSGAGALTGTVRVTTKKPGVTGAVVRTSGTALLSAATAGADAAPIAGERSIAASGSVRDGDVAARASVRLNGGAEQLWRLRAVPLRFERVAGVALPVTKADVDVVTGDDATLNARGVVSVGAASADVAFAHDLEQQPLSDFSHGLTDAPQTQTRDLVRARLLWQGDVAGAHVETVVGGGHHERALRVPLFPREGLFDDGGLLRVDGRADTASGLARVDVAVAASHRLLFAAFGDVTHASAQSASTDPVTGDETDDLVSFDDVSGSVNGAVEYQGDFGGGVHATAGLLAHWRTGFAPGLSPRLALSWRSGGVSVDGSYGEGVRAPDRFDVTALAKAVVDGRVVGAAGNPDLRPELVRTVQLGAGFAPSSALHLSLRAFGLRHEDAVVAVADAALLRPVNSPPRHLLGAELAADVAPFQDVVHLRGGLIGVAVVDGDGASDADRNLAQAVVDASLSPIDAFTVGVRGRAALRSVDGDAVDRAVVDGYASATIKDAVVVVFVVRNALDALELANDDEAPPFADPVRYPGAGRSLTLAVEGHF